MPTLVVKERNLATIGKHAHTIDRPRRCEERPFKRNFACGKRTACVEFHAEEMRNRGINRVTRLHIVERSDPRLQLIFRCRLDNRHASLFGPIGAHRKNCIARWRNPKSSRKTIRFATRGVGAFRLKERTSCTIDELQRAAFRTNFVRGNHVGGRVAFCLLRARYTKFSLGLCLALAILCIDGFRLRRRRVTNDDHTVEIVRHRVAEFATRHRAHKPRMTSKGLLAPRIPRFNATVRTLGVGAINPENLDALVKAILEGEMHRRTLATTPSLAWLE